MIHPATMGQVTCGQSPLSRCSHTAGNNLETRPAARDDTFANPTVRCTELRVHRRGGRHRDRAPRHPESAALVASYRKSNFLYEVHRTV